MIQAHELKAAGYKSFSDNMSQATECWQKRVMQKVDGEWRTLYWINLYLYTFDHLDVLDGNGAHHWELKMYFERQCDVLPYGWLTFQVSSESSIETIELAADQVWRANQGKMYQ